MSVLTVKGLRKEYRTKGKTFVAVDDVTFDLAPGEILGLLGPNGAGKTTTIQMLLSVLTPTKGEIFYFGKDFSEHRSEILSQVVFASTYVSLPWSLTIEQNLRVFAQLYGFAYDQIKNRAEELLSYFGILGKKHAHVSSLSAGQITRLVLVKAFMIKPRIVLLDEPTASLDPDVARDVCQFVLQQRDELGTSILFTSHKMSEVAEICDRVLFLQKGRIIANDVPDQLARSVSTSKVHLIVGDGMKRIVSIADRLGLIYNIEHRQIELHLDEPQIALFLSAIAEERVVYTSIDIVRPTLEDYFIKMVDRGASS